MISGLTDLASATAWLACSSVHMLAVNYDHQSSTSPLLMTYENVWLVLFNDLLHIGYAWTMSARAWTITILLTLCVANILNGVLVSKDLSELLNEWLGSLWGAVKSDESVLGSHCVG